MQVLLNQDVKKLGRRGDVVSVKDGYFRNFLWPQGFAQAADANTLKLVESRKQKRAVEKEQILENAKDVLKKLDGLSVSIKAKANDKGNLYAAISEHEVIDAVEAVSKIKLEDEFVKMEHFKDLGDHEVKVVLGEGLEATVKVVIEAE